MNSKTKLAEKIESLVEQIQKNDRQLPWVVQSGCSYRRIATEPTKENGARAKDGNVLSACRHNDGYLDLSMPETQLDALCKLVNMAPEVVKELKGENGKEGLSHTGVDPKENVTQEDREAMVSLEKLQARSSGLPLKFIKPKLDAIMSGDFDRSPEIRAFVDCRLKNSSKQVEAIKPLIEALEKIAEQDLPPSLIEQFSAGHREAISVARSALVSHRGHQE